MPVEALSADRAFWFEIPIISQINLFVLNEWESGCLQWLQKYVNNILLFKIWTLLENLKVKDYGFDGCLKNIFIKQN